MQRTVRWIWLLAAALLSGCASRGTLLPIGGGLADDNTDVSSRFAALAARHGSARIVVATAASADQDAAAKGRLDAMARWCPRAKVEIIRRETPTADAVAAIDRATAMYFTGGDQKRITDRYRPGNADGPELAAMRRLLARGGVIAGTSAGDAMMSRTMFLTGGSPAALGIAGRDDENGAPGKLGPQIGPGMGFLKGVILDSHFFERNRVGRLVAALETSGEPLGLGIGENAGVEIDLEHKTARCITTAGALLVDIRFEHREGLTRRGMLAFPLEQGSKIRFATWSAPSPPRRPDRQPVEVPVVAAHESAPSWELFRRASREGAWQLTLDGWRIIAWPAGSGWVAFDIEPTPSRHTNRTGQPNRIP